MLNSPFRYEEWLTPGEYQKLGELMLRWSHIDHIIGNCLSAMLRLSPEEAAAMVFPLSMDLRLQRLKKLVRIHGISEEAQNALDALVGVMEYIKKVRTNVVHAIMVDDAEDGLLFHLRSKQRTLTKDQVFQAEELTNYAAHAVMSFRYALGLKDAPDVRHSLPDKPEIPDFLRNPAPTRIRAGQPLSPRPPASGA